VGTVVFDAELLVAANTTVPTSMAWNPGVSGSIVLIRAYYTWPLITPLLRTGLQSADGKRIIYAATAFTNEPYEE
jgi:Flp pilus assembly protein TadG